MLYCEKEKIKFYFNFSVNTYSELLALKNINAEYAIIDAPLFHDIKNAAKVGIKLRVVPNVAYYASIPRAEGVRGSWIRPEDLNLYDSYISAIEFEDCDIKKEQALFRIYIEQKAWPGDLGKIITNLDYPGVNRMISSDLTKRRMECGQRCYEGLHCRLCYHYLDLANPNLLRKLKQNN